MQVNISPHTISRFLYGSDYHPPVNTGEMEYKLREIQKITRKQIGMEDKIGNFRWIINSIEANCENAIWVFGGP